MDFLHRFEPAAEVATAPVLLLLHGTGGTENDLLDLGREICPGASRLSPRGKVLEHDMPRFFRRLEEGVFDIEDLIRRTHELADFVTAASVRYGFPADKVWALGYSNGANIASSTMLLRPGILRGGVLLRGMVPLIPEKTPDLAGTEVLIAAGKRDSLVSVEESESLAELFRAAGATVGLHFAEGGHQLTCDDLKVAHEWCRRIR